MKEPELPSWTNEFADAVREKEFARLTSLLLDYGPENSEGFTEEAITLALASLALELNTTDLKAPSHVIETRVIPNLACLGYVMDHGERGNGYTFIGIYLNYDDNEWYVNDFTSLVGNARNIANKIVEYCHVQPDVVIKSKSGSSTGSDT